MIYSVTKKQKMSKMCFVCGMENQFGVKARFYELENGSLVAIVKPKEEYQSYPNRMHGGVSSAVLDETIGRAIMILEPETWGVTGTLNLKYKKPVPLDRPIKIVARVLHNNTLSYDASGEILLEDGTVAVEARGMYVKMSLSKIAGRAIGEDDLFDVYDEDDPVQIEL